MEYTILNNNLIISGVRDFNLEQIFECGQCFRWNREPDGSYIGTAYGRTLKISQSDDTLTLYETSIKDFEDIWYHYFDFDIDYSKIKDTLSAKDAVMKNAVAYGSGIRILNQELWECVVSFIISASNNIPRIKKIISVLCEQFGDKISYIGNTYYSFPSIDKIYSLTLNDLSVIKAGFRDKYILAAAKAFKEEFNEEFFTDLSCENSKKALLTINGIGNKVSDCILLFSLGKRNSFPVDVWIKRVVEHFYFEEKQKISDIVKFSDEKFGALGGYAQQYLFYYARENKIGM